jgi:hypothetical protein
MSMQQQQGHSKGFGGPPPQQYSRGPYGFSPPSYPLSRTNAPIKSVVTTSFEEREDRHMERRDGGFAPPGYGMRQERSPPHYSSEREGTFHNMEPPQMQQHREHHGVAGREPMDHLEREEYGGRDSRVYARELPPIREGGMEGRHPRHEMTRGAREGRVPPSPHDEASFINRSLSNTSSMASYRSHASLKRSFWHHARPEDEYQQGASLPKDFLPPKRSKVTPPSARGREYVVTARPSSNHHHEDVYHSERHGAPSRSPGWFNRAMSWEASRDDYYQRDPSSKVYTGSWSSRSPPSYRDERPGSYWTDAPPMPSPRTRYAHQPESSFETSPGDSYTRWNPAEEHQWGPVLLGRDEFDKQPSDGRERGSFAVEMRRQGTFESVSVGELPLNFNSRPSPRGMEPFQSESMPQQDTIPMAAQSPERQKDGTLLLALPGDRISLSETLCLVREVRKNTCFRHFLKLILSLT